ncbi:MAG TPA: homoserine kinase [Polyangiaceae bacterium]
MVEAGSVNSNFSLICDGKRFFLRIFEEQGEAGAADEIVRIRTISARGVLTPAAVGQGTLAGKPAALFPWVDGGISCQRAVSPARAFALGRALADVHRAGADLPASPNRFDAEALRARLGRIERAYPVVRLRAALDAAEAARDPNIPRGFVHGDLFRDNVLWAAPGSDRLVALLDFESASHGPLAFDLAVTLLAWCYGDAFEPSLARALVAGYEAARPMGIDEKRALYTESLFGAIRFTITRITDYAMRGGENRVMKDWRRFLARLDALEAMGPSGFEALIT